MPHVEHGPLAGNLLPDYDGGSTVNLMASLIAARGGTSPHAPLDDLDISPLQQADTLLYLVLDGLGLHQLRRHLDQGYGKRFFARHPHRRITTVFPATTAAAVTTFDTGSSPTEHAVLSWYLNLPDLGVLSTVLRTTSRIGAPLLPDDFDLRAYYRVPSYVETMDVHRGLLSYGDIPEVPFSVVGTRWLDRRSYLDLPGLVDTVEAFATEAPGEKRFGYVYWPRYDGLCHEHGIHHAEITAHFEELDVALADLEQRLAGKSVALCILADHGLVDVGAENCIDVATVPGFMDCLATAPGGDQRQINCFVRPRAETRFVELVERELGHACVCVPGEMLLEAGAFGPGEPHPELARRLGDYVLLCKPGYSLIHTPPGLEPMVMPGSHGGMSQPEIEIPLFVIQP